MFDEAIAVVADVLLKQSESDWNAAYSAKGMEEMWRPLQRFSALCGPCLPSHGQMIYLVKEMERQAANKLLAAKRAGAYKQAVHLLNRKISSAIFTASTAAFTSCTRTTCAPFRTDAVAAASEPMKALVGWRIFAVNGQRAPDERFS